MALYRTEGIVLRTRNFGEADRIITLFTKDEGKVQVVASGARRMRSRLLSLCQPFLHGTFFIFRGNNLDRISQGELINSYRELSEDLISMAQGAYIAELVDVFMEERDPQEEIFHLLVATFDWLSRLGPNANLVRYFELQLLNLVGYRPQLDSCTLCGKPGGNFGIPEGGMLCASCETPASIPLNLGTWETLRQFSKGKIRILGILKTSNVVAQEMENILRAYIAYHGQKELKSLGFLRSLGEG